MILIVNADDFGMSAGVNRGIIQAHQAGIVTSTSLMVRGAAVAEAVALARENPRLGVGLHVDLCEWVYREDDWQLQYSVVPPEDAAAVAVELARQLDAFHELMQCPPTHLDSHQHVHRDPPLRRLIQAAARKLGIPVRHFHPAIAYCGDFYGQSDKGYAYHAAIQVDALLNIIRTLPDRTLPEGTLPEGIVELACHPASIADTGSTYDAERVLELQSLCDPRVRAALSEAGVELQSFRAVAT